MKFQVPQFIEIEDKIFGPLTIKQFIYLVGAGGISFILWVMLPLFVAVLFAAPVVALALALAFYKVNNRPFVLALESALRYFTSSRLYIWKKEEKKVEAQKKDEAEKNALLSVPTLSESKLKDLAWSLDIKESAYSGGRQKQQHG